jgi:Kef-type K+ transport system membrane component KefB
MTAGVFELAVIVIIAAGLGVIARMLKQPAILAYLATGVIAGYLKFLPTLGDRETFSVLADLGIMFLLFLIGLEINYSSLRLVGKTSLIVGVAQIILTFAIGFALSVLFQFSYLHAAYIAVALTFSSTIIVVNLLTEKKDLNSLYGKISVGFLLVQDFIAILILVVLSGFQMGDGVIWFSVVTTLVKGVALFGFMLWLGKSAMPYVFNKVAFVFG